MCGPNMLARQDKLVFCVKDKQFRSQRDDCQMGSSLLKPQVCFKYALHLSRSTQTPYFYLSRKLSTGTSHSYIVSAMIHNLSLCMMLSWVSRSIVHSCQNLHHLEVTGEIGKRLIYMRTSVYNFIGNFSSDTCCSNFLGVQ
jgi:hypothetical protein